MTLSLMGRVIASVFQILKKNLLINSHEREAYQLILVYFLEFYVVGV